MVVTGEQKPFHLAIAQHFMSNTKSINEHTKKRNGKLVINMRSARETHTCTLNELNRKTSI